MEPSSPSTTGTELSSPDAIPSALDIDLASRSYESWIHGFVANRAADVLSTGGPGGVPSILPEATADRLGEVARTCYQLTLINSMSQAGVCLLLGRLILEQAARAGCSKDDAIEQLQLEDSSSKAANTLRNYADAAARFYSHQLPGLTVSHYLAATSFGGPKDDPSKIAEFEASRREILELAAKDPDERGGNWVRAQMRELQDRMGVTRKRRVTRMVLFGQIANTVHYLEEATDEQIAAKGHTRADVRDYLRDLIEQSRENGHMACTDYSDPAGYVEPWRL